MRNAMIRLETPTIAEPWRALGNITDEIVARLEQPHPQQVECACEGKGSPDLRSLGSSERGWALAMNRQVMHEREDIRPAGM